MARRRQHPGGYKNEIHSATITIKTKYTPKTL